MLYGPGTDSGTFDYFTEAIVGETGSSRADYTASEDDNVLVQGVSTDANALGYFGFAYYEENTDRLQAVAIDSGNGPVLPTRENVEQNRYNPLSRPLFIYINAEAAQNNSKVRDFVQYYLSRPDLVDEVGYVRLPANAYTVALRNFQDGKTGSVFAGRDTIGVSIEDLMALEGVE
jgi:phosphate transport system substrate-binding protein